jgi:hypothetical protein
MSMSIADGNRLRVLEEEWERLRVAFGVLRGATSALGEQLRVLEERLDKLEERQGRLDAFARGAPAKAR